MSLSHAWQTAFGSYRRQTRNKLLVAETLHLSAEIQLCVRGTLSANLDLLLCNSLCLYSNHILLHCYILYDTYIFVVQIPDYRNAVIVARHPGAVRRATSYAERLRLSIAVIHGEEKIPESEREDGRNSPPLP